jgi:hypothetical protein
MASRRKVTLDTFADALKEILDEYAGEITDSVQEVTAKVTKAGAKAVKSESLSSFNDVHLKKGRYGTGWTTQIETGRLSAQGVIYNKKYPGLPHLLEHGHAMRGGGRTKGKLHIAPVEKKIIEMYEREIINDIK